MMKRVLVLSCLICSPVWSQASDAGLQSGHIVGKHIFGLARDHQLSPLMVGEDPLIYENEASHYDFTLSETNLTVSLFDHSPGGIYLSEKGIKGDEYLDTHALDLEPVSGLARPVAGIKTPWGSLLFSESENVDAAGSNEFVSTMASFFKGKDDLVNPYHYGWPAEVVLLEAEGQAGEAKVIKDYGMGRVAASQILVMPDAKTVYLLDGEHSGNLYVFVAEQANSLTQGTLYGVVFDGRSVGYHELGQGAALKTKFRLRRASFDTFFDTEQPQNGECPPGFDYSESVYGSECLKVQERSRAYVGLFEPIRMMALSTESAAQKKVQSIKYDSASQRLSLVQADERERTFPLEPHSEMQSQYIMEVSP